MTGALCVLCRAPLPDLAYACSPCCERLTRDLGDVPALASAVEDAVARNVRTGTGVGTPVTGSTDRALPWNEAASTARRRLLCTLNRWVTVLRTPRDPRPATINGCAAWLRVNINTIRCYQFAAYAFDDITRAVDDVRRVVDRPPDRLYAGPCGSPSGPPRGGFQPLDPPCDGELYAALDHQIVRCPKCHASYDVAERRRWLLDAVWDVTAYASLLAAALTRLDEPLTAARVRKWAQRGQLLARGVDLEGRPLYRVGDAIALLDSTRRKDTDVT